MNTNKVAKRMLDAARKFGYEHSLPGHVVEAMAESVDALYTEVLMDVVAAATEMSIQIDVAPNSNRLVQLSEILRDALARLEK